MFDCRGKEVRRIEFPTAGSYSSPIREGSFELRGDRVTRLGTNMYACTVHPQRRPGSGCDHHHVCVCLISRFNTENPEETRTSKTPSVKAMGRFFC